MEKYLALKASAGSGKTFALTVRYITLLLLGAKPNEILTLTFTNKAAAEMSQRVLNTLQTLGDDKAYLGEISRVSNLSEDEILSKKKSLLNLFSNSSLSIYTIDKFVNKILKEFGGYAGVSDDFEILSDDEELLGYHFLNSLDESSFKDLVDFSLYEGKKFNSLFTLFKSLIEKNEEFDTLDIDASLIDLLKDEILKCSFKIKEHFLNCSEASNSAIKAVDFTNFEELFLKTWIQKDSLFDYSYFKKCANETINNEFLNLKELFFKYYKVRASYSLSKIFKLFNKFKEFKFEFNKRKNYYEFNDISNMVYMLLNSKIDRDFLYFRLDSNYNHILIDEFQDTSILQYNILKPLIEEIISGNSEKFKTFFYVGDPKQSIYRFRGGNKELFDYVLKQNSQISLNSLNTNYRSNKVVVDFVNSVFTKLDNFDYEVQNSIKDSGFVEVIEDDSLELDDKFLNISKKIQELLDSGINQSDIAILCYTNSDVLNLYYYLKKVLPNIKISTDMSSKLINAQNVKAVINLIKYLYFKEEIYKENFNAIIGKNINSSLDTNFEFKEKSVEEIIFFLANSFELLDDNVVKLMQDTTKFKNIVEFIYEIDKLESSIENSENSGVQILTIFKSKGLEFQTVILLDRIKRKNHDRSSFLFSYKNMQIDKVFYKIAGLESFDKEYEKALEKEKSLSLDDEKNVLYVALTRAKSNLIVFKKTKSSVFDILNLKSYKDGILEKSSEKKVDKSVEKIEYSALFLGKQEQKIKVDLNLGDDYLKAKYLGLATHYTLEMMNDFTKDDLDYSLQLSKSRYLSYLSIEDFKIIEKRVELLIQNSQFLNLVNNSLKVHEQSLMYKNELKIVDLLLYKDGFYTIIDYKTTSDILSSHKIQVNYYKKAIIDIFKTENVKAYLVYLKESGIDLIEV
ncbi:RecB-like helicase [Aliarcobacter skirrowii]|uniref:DNA 3'-5' helicase n=4 Tax=Aliarcobacter skirrowii TaxID=28200 RepID=A0A2U2C2V5_9BACT|nr:RecB-like helicase [Aliarcobacter skirrowii]PWE22763.1 RecB-like helicase [Aliarcobacter skirrowii]PWE23361.1 RecB-like helicase [Aliarcobacter skirrowii]RJO56588.1 RecB-like helicase [Aliarcobacter skirrowii]RJO58542.1 RecB-like helicase [Aliarcobacter skirrowii]